VTNDDEEEDNELKYVRVHAKKA